MTDPNQPPSYPPPPGVGQPDPAQSFQPYPPAQGHQPSNRPAPGVGQPYQPPPAPAPGYGYGEGGIQPPSNLQPSQIQAVSLVERYIRERRDTDRPLVSWGLYFFLLSWVTFGIYPIVIFYRRLNRVDLYRNRKSHLYQSILDFTRQRSQAAGAYDSVHHQIEDLDAYVKDRFMNMHKPINAGLSLVLSFFTLGIYGWIAIARTMRFWWEIQVTEQDFDERLSQIWMRIGVVRYPITFQPNQVLRRSFWMHFFLSIVTFGIYGIIWDHRLHTDPDKVYPEFHTTEDMMLNAVRGATG